MTNNANLKRRVRERATKTGESYTAARRHLVPMNEPATPMVIAAAQTRLCPDPRSRSQLRESGTRVRELMHRAAAAGAALVQFPEGALTSPHKRIVSSRGLDIVAEADWSSVDPTALTAELDAVADTARELQLWVVVGGIHFSGDDPRPTNALFVLSPRGAPAGRYDERMLSCTKSTFMYRAGTQPLVFEARGMRFGCTAGMETHYPELFAAYERAAVDCVLHSTAGNPDLPDVFAIEAAGHAATNSYWVRYSGPAHTGEPPAGVISPSGTWAARCTTSADDIAVAVDRHHHRRASANLASLRPRGGRRAPLTHRYNRLRRLRPRPSEHISRGSRLQPVNLELRWGARWYPPAGPLGNERQAKWAAPATPAATADHVRRIRSPVLIPAVSTRHRHSPSQS